MNPLQPENPRQSLAEQPWFVELLAERGFRKSSHATFSRGQASITVSGSVVTADPGSGKTWSTDFKDADPASVKVVLGQILKMRPFQTEEDLAQERAERQRLERALTGIANAIKEGPETGSGVQLRRFLWSLYNGHHLINLWRMTCVLDATCGVWVAEVLEGALVGVLKEDDIKRALLVAGEMQRWDDGKPSSEQEREIAEALERVNSALSALPPSQAHTDLNRASELLRQAGEALGLVRRTTPGGK